MSIWLDFLGAEIRFFDTPTYGRVRVAEAGKGKPEALFLMHGIGGHIEAYSKNVVTLGRSFHTIAFDFVGHGLSEKKTDISSSSFAGTTGEFITAENCRCARSGFQTLSSASRADKFHVVRPSAPLGL